MNDKTVIIGGIGNTCWVSVDERLPNEGHWYIAYSRNLVIELFYDGENEHGVHWLKDGDWDDPVTHWMPLPPPPEGVPITKGEK